MVDGNGIKGIFGFNAQRNANEQKQDEQKLKEHNATAHKPTEQKMGEHKSMEHCKCDEDCKCDNDCKNNECDCNDDCKCDCGEDCKCDDNCKCDCEDDCKCDSCECEHASKNENKCACMSGGKCICGDNCECVPEDACECAEGKECTCGENCKCKVKNKNSTSGTTTNAKPNSHNTELELKNSLQMLQAEFENYQKRQLKQNNEYAKFANANLIEQLLPVIDTLEIGKQHDKALEQILGQVVGILKKNGLEEIKVTKGEAFDHNKMECLLTVEDKNVPSGKVVEVLSRGYLFHTKLLRPVKVSIAK
jgi:molecular chaperone GrpE